MTIDRYAATLARLRESVTELDRTVRARALEVVAHDVVVLTNEAMDGEGALVVALARIALRSMPARAAALSIHRSQGDGADTASNVARARERALRDAADRVDLALVALTAAAALAPGASASGQRDGLDYDTLIGVALEIAKPERHRLLRERALQLIAVALAQLPRSQRAFTLGIEPLRTVRQYAFGAGASRFVQRAALEVLIEAKGAEVEQDLLEVSQSASGPDAMLQRHHVVALIPKTALEMGDKLRFVWAQRTDPSEHVRQGVVQALCELGRHDARPFTSLADMAERDASPRVAALGLLGLAAAAARAGNGTTRPFVRLLGHACLNASPILHRAALAAIRSVAQSSQSALFARDLAGALDGLIQNAGLDTAEMAAALAREIQLESAPATLALCRELRRAIRERREGQTFTVELAPALVQRDLEQAAYVVSCLDLSLEIVPRRHARYELYRGERRGFRVWRLLHELSHRGPDKRQSHLHTHSRLARPHTTTVPMRQAEVTPTLVPGERRVLIGSSWGCFLPRVDDVFAACHAPRGKRLISAFGTLTVRAPDGLWRRLRLRASLTRRYAELCQMRDQSLTAVTKDGKRRFALELRRLGVEIELSESQVRVGGQPVSTLPQSVHQFFSFGLPLPLALWLEDALQYVVSPSGNTAWHLAIVVWTVLAVMVIRAARIQRRFAGARRNIPLSIGGWGSRGKSGTERLKSALFHSLHTDVVSKTTGCEAMLILARRDQTAHEIFLYRPYDKATIWEQEAVVEYAESLGAQVFLWECMALQPEFVDILNREWMKDRITTITNAYPDHEDIMGPSGEDVARVIGRFIPTGGTVLSSEEQMEAIIRESATRLGSQIIEVDELAADLLPRDLLARFPYQEHPRNVALALRMAEHLGFDRERSLIDMADHVVPDLGVLNTFPRIAYKGRSLRFSNGMSANERAGFMSNWNRLYFVTHDPDKHPDTILAAVINNRADRVPRSRVFAEVFARDVAVDLMIVIGTNVQGMKRFMYEAIAVEAAQIRPPESSSDAPAWIESTFDRLGVPKSLAAVERRLRLSLDALTGPADAAAREELERHLTEALAVLSDPDAPGFDDGGELEARAQSTLLPLAACLGKMCLPERGWADTEALRQAEHRATLISLVSPWLERRFWTRRLPELLDPARSKPQLERLRATYCRLFEQRVIILEDSDSTGDQVVDFVFRHIPPGLHAEVMGCQNIKGTGLDFVYRFVELQRVSDWLGKLDTEASERPALLAQLSTHLDYGLFGCQFAMSRVQAVLDDPPAHFRRELGSLAELAVYLKERERFFIGKMSRTTTKSRWHVLLGWIEPWVDNLDGIRRRKRAERIMHALVEGKMDTASAAEALRTVVARQKGGWLAKDFTRMLARDRAPHP